MTDGRPDQQQPGPDDPGGPLESPELFERLITEISGRFTHLAPENVDREIRAVLAQIGDFMGVDRCFVFSLSEDESRHAVSHLWTRPEHEQDAVVLGTVIQDGFPWVGAQMLRRKDIVINVLDELPPEAVVERAYCSSVGIQSFLMCPMCSSDMVLGSLGIDAIRVQHSWSDRDIRRLRLIGEVIANELTRKHLNLNIQERLAFEEMVAEVSSDLVSAQAEQIVEVVEQALAKTAEFLRADRCILYSIDTDDGDARKLHWVADRLTPEQSHIPTENLKARLPVWTGQLLQEIPVVIRGLAELSASATKERAYAESVGLQSSIMIPLRINGQWFVLALDVFSEPCDWPTGIDERLRILGTALANALVRREKEVEIQHLKDRLEAENSYLREAAELSYSHDEIVGNSKVIRKMLRQVEQVANTDSRVLIRGETGTGKGLVARAIHHLSGRKDRPLVAVNCAALSPTLIENELFGCEKGAYTGAVTRQVGRFEIADGSTLFLDEIGELAPEVQAKLLRILEDGEFERLGSPKTRKVDVRVIAATNRDLEKAVAEGAFRQDLYFRLSVFPIHVPPLRDRREDVPLMVWAFIKEFEPTVNRVIERVAKSTMEALQDYDWHGNVRELRNVVERAMILGSGRVLQVDLLHSAAGPTQSAPQTLAELEEQHIRAVLEQTGWRVRGRGKAADLLGLNPSTLESRMKKLDIHRP